MDVTKQIAEKLHEQFPRDYAVCLIAVTPSGDSVKISSPVTHEGALTLLRQISVMQRTSTLDSELMTSASVSPESASSFFSWPEK